MFNRNKVSVGKTVLKEEAVMDTQLWQCVLGASGFVVGHESQ